MGEVAFRRDTDLLSWRLIGTIATAADVDPLALEPRLGDVVDVDALVRLVEGDALDEVHFEFGGHTVAVGGDGHVSVAGSVTTDHEADGRRSASATETATESGLREHGS